MPLRACRIITRPRCYPLAHEKVRYVGEPMVAVLAENRYLAEDALELIEIAYEPLATETDPRGPPSRRAAAARRGGHEHPRDPRVCARRLAEAEWRRATVRVGGRFRFRRKAPVAIENRACFAEYDRGRRSLTLTLSTQIPGIVRDTLADLLGLPGHSVRVVAPDVGGGFGGKASLYPEEMLVCVLARTPRPRGAWTGDRLEDLARDQHGFDEIVDAELGLDADGRILALSAEVSRRCRRLFDLSVDRCARAGASR